MSQIKFFKTLTIVLVLLNITVIAFFFLRHHGPRHHHFPPHHGRPLFEIIERKLNLNGKQRQQFKIMRESHHEQMMALDRKRDELLKKYFESIGNGQTSGNNLIGEIINIEKERIDITYKHFEDIKALCKEEQLKDFPEVLDIAIEHLLSSNKKGPPPPKD